MKWTLLYVSIGFCFLLLGTMDAVGNPINAVIGDVSYTVKFGKIPDATVSEQIRIVTHLEFVEQELLKKDISSLPVATREARKKNIERLREYRLRGVFPINYDYPGTRVPCFIDRENNICALGYLVEQSAGRPIAEAINKAHQYEYVLEMDCKELDEWLISSGLTKVEAAMIQPTYGGANPVDDVEQNGNHRIFEVASMFANVSTSVGNVVVIGRQKRNLVWSFLGLATGAAGCVAGFSDRAQYTTGDLAFASGAVILSIWNLTLSDNPKPAYEQSESKIFSPEIRLTMIPLKEEKHLIGVNIHWNL